MMTTVPLRTALSVALVAAPTAFLAAGEHSDSNTTRSFDLSCGEALEALNNQHLEKHSVLEAYVQGFADGALAMWGGDVDDAKDLIERECASNRDESLQLVTTRIGENTDLDLIYEAEQSFSDEQTEQREY